MAAVASITLFDALVTPVSHSFIPLGPDSSGVWWWEDQSATATIGYNRISMSLLRVGNPAPGASSKDRVNRVKIGFHTPKLEVLGNTSTGLTPPPTVAYVARCNIEFILPERSSLQDRKDLRKYIDNIMAETQVTNMIENLQGVY